MEVKTAELKAKLSQYLRHVREEGSTYVVLDRKTPVALLTPLTQDKAKQGETERLFHLRQKLEERGMHVRPSLARHDALPDPTPAPDGRTDQHAIDTVRGEKDY